MAQSIAALYAPWRGAKPEATLADLMRAMRTRWRWIAIPTLLAFVGSLVFVNMVSPRYTAEAKLLLQTGDSYFTRPGAERGEQGALIDDQAVASQVQVVMSRDLAREAIKQLGLVGNPEFDPGAREAGWLQRIASLVGLGREAPTRAPEDRILEKYYENLLVYPVGKSRIVSIEFRSKDPDLAAKAVNTVAELYLGLQEDAKKDMARSASTWLGSNIDSLRTRVATAEAKVEEFRARTGLLVGSGTTTLSAQQLSELSAQLAQARTAQSDAQAKAALIRELVRDGRGFEIPDVANNELIRRLIEQRINLRAQLALESRTLLSQHPRIKELNAQLNDLEAQLRGAAERIARTLETDSRIAGSRMESLTAAIDAQKKVVALANEGEVQLRALEREARIQRDQLESYLGRYREATARDVGNAAPPDARVVSRAVVPQIPSFPKKLPIVALCTFAALMLSAGAIVARELLGGSEGAAMAEAAAPRPVGVEAPPYGRTVTAASVLSPDPAMPSPVALRTGPDPRYDFGNLVARLERTPVVDRAHRVLVSGVERGAEADDVGRGLALTLARTHRTLLIELDGNEDAAGDVAGLTDLVAGSVSFADVLHRQPGSPLHRISVGTLKNEALTGDPEGLDVALSALEKTYEWIVCVILESRGPELMQLVAPRVDTAVIASNLEPANQDLVRAYEAAQNAGAREVVVAREQAAPELDSAAA